MEGTLLTFESVSKSYGRVQALVDVSLELRRGEVFGYIGPNGAGKTTTIKILTGLIRNYRGRVSVDGIDARTDDAGLHRRIGYLPQDVGFQEWRTVEQALHTFGKLSGLASAELPARISAALQTAGIQEHRKRRIVHLSGGTVQRLRLAQAILHDPEILVLDEPLSGLDPASRVQLRETVRELAGENRMVFVSSHILSELEGLATHIGILHEGRIREVGTPAELRKRYQVGTVVEVTAAPGSRIAPEQLSGAPVTRTEPTGVADTEVARLHVDPAADLDDAMRTIMRRILDHRVPVRSVRHMQPSLEEVYMALVAGGTQ
jgi:ABC-2 type transport system ATP-binding protein